MSRPLFSNLAALSVALLTLGAGQADAGWDHWGGSSGGSYGSYGSGGGSYGSSGGYGGSGGWGSSGGYGSSGGWSSYGSGRRQHVGLFKRLHRRWHARHVAGYSHGSSGGYSSHGSWGSSYGSSGGYAYGSHGGYGSSGGSSGGAVISGGETYYSPMEAEAPAPPDAPDAPAPPMAPGEDAREASNSGNALLKVAVPANAKVYVNGVATSSTGDSRQYISRGLMPGYAYSYEVRAEVEQDGRMVEETKTVQLRAGESASLAFALEGGEQAVTSVTVNVPADAKVYLAGNATLAAGETRTFKTSQLPSGSEWADYTVRVELERDGRTVSQEQTITLRGGDNRTLNFDFPTAQIADAR